MAGLKDVLKKRLPTELFSQVDEALGDDFDWDYIPKSRLDKVIGERNDLRVQIAELNEKIEVQTQDGADRKFTAKEVEAEVAKAKTEFDKQLASTKISFAVTEKLREARVRKPELLIPQLQMDQVKMDDKGVLTGLDEQLSAWKESDPYLFTDYVPSGTGVSGVRTSGSTVESLEAQYQQAVKNGNTVLAVTLKNQMFDLQKG